MGFFDMAGNMFKAGAKGVGHAAASVGRKAANGFDRVGNAGDKVGRAGFGAARKAAHGAEYVAKDAWAGAHSTNGFYNPFGFAAEKAYQGATKTGYWKRETHTYDRATGKVKVDSGGLKFTKLGLGVLFGAGALSGSVDAVQTAADDRVGAVDPQTVTATPTIKKQDYTTNLDDGGATGDLVFALHNNRHG